MFTYATTELNELINNVEKKQEIKNHLFIQIKYMTKSHRNKREFFNCFSQFISAIIWSLFKRRSRYLAATLVGIGIILKSNMYL